MYLVHWGLDTPPFHESAAARVFQAGEAHDEALARLEFLVQSGRSLGLLLGRGGLGKTVCLEVLERRLRGDAYQVARGSALDLTSEEWLEAVARGLGASSVHRGDKSALWRAIEDRHRDLGRLRRTAVLLVDDADEASDDLERHWERLLAAATARGWRLSIVLAARDSFEACMSDRLVDLVDLRVELGPWRRDDTASFLTRALAAAGRQRPAFEERAVTHLHRLTEGVPRRVARMADLSLIAAAYEGLPLVTAETVESVHDELQVSRGEHDWPW